MDKAEFKYYAQLVKRAQAGDEEAFKEIYRRTKPAQICHLRGILGTTEEIQDALQEVYALLYQNLKKINPPTVLIAYLNRLSYYVGRNMERKQSRRRRTFSNMEWMDQIEGEQYQEELHSYENQEIYGRVREAIDQLSEQQRSVIIMRYYQKLKYEDVAMSLGITQSKAKRIMSSAQENLRKLLKKQGIRNWELVVAQSFATEGGKRIKNRCAQELQPGLFTAATGSTSAHVGAAAMGLSIFIAGGTGMIGGPVISSVQSDEEPVNTKARIEMQIDSGVPVHRLTVENSNGKTYEGRRDYDNIYYVEVPENGSYRITAETNQGKKTVADCQVDSVDKELPRVADIRTEKELTRVIFEEDKSGVDLDSIYCEGPSGEIIKPLSVEGDGRSALFRLPESDQTLYFKDRAGNISRLPLYYQ